VPGKPRIESMSLDACLAMRHQKNPKEHDLPGLIDSIIRFGFMDYPTIDEGTMIMVEGHGRCLALEKMRAEGYAVPDGIEAEGSDWRVPIIRGLSFRDAMERDAYIIAHNQHVMRGGYNLDLMTEFLQGIATTDSGFKGIGFDDVELASFGFQPLDLTGADEQRMDEGGTPGDADRPPDGSKETGPDADAGGMNRSAQVSVFSDDQVIQACFDHYRSAGFPYPDPPIGECMVSINRLASMSMEQLVRTHEGLLVADKFQRHRFAAVADGMLSPLQSFADDKKLLYVIKINLEAKGVTGDGSLRSTLGMVQGAQTCSNFRPGFAAYLYRRFVPPGGVVLDTSAGYGGRLVGALASTVVSRYIGIDPNQPSIDGSRRLLTMLGVPDFAELVVLPAEDIPLSRWAGLCDFMFTSPPYFNKERYSDDPTQSGNRYPEADQWRERFLVPMMRLSFESLKPGAHAAINIADVLVGGIRHPLGDWTVAAGKLVGFDHLGTVDFPVGGTRFGSDKGKGSDNAEPVFLFKKPDATAPTKRRKRS
jgi:hypothetical protein